MKLSLIAHAQYPASTINGRFLALPCHPSFGHLVSLSAIILDKHLNEHITSIHQCIDLLKKQQYAHPVLILDVAAWLTCSFGPHWQLLLPMYNYYGELLTRAEYDTQFPMLRSRIKRQR
jgi:hypothetical protein